MAISAVVQRDTQLEKQRAGFLALTLTNFDNNNEPAITAGSVIEISGSLYEVTVAEVIGGAAVAGANYIYFANDGSAFNYSNVAPTWSDAKQGWYNAGNDRAVAGFTFDSPDYERKYIFDNLTQRISNFPSGIRIDTFSVAKPLPGTDHIITELIGAEGVETTFTNSPTYSSVFFNRFNNVNSNLGVRCLLDGTITVYGEFRVQNGTAYFRVLKNGVQEIEWNTTSTTFVSVSQNINVEVGDLLTYQLKNDPGGSGFNYSYWQYLRVYSNNKVPAVVF